MTSPASFGDFETLWGMTAVRLGAVAVPCAHRGDVYLPARPPRTPRLFCRSGETIPPSSLARLQRSGVTTVWMPASQADAWRNRLRELMAEGLDVPAAILLETAREAIRDEMSEAWRAKTSDALVSCAARFSQQVVDLCAKRDEMADALASIAVHDGNTFAHSTNVCTYVVMLAQASGISSNCTLLELGQAALLHDLGKRRVHAEILNKPGPLSLAERETMNDHPRIGFQDLCRQPNLTREQLLMVYQHHERIDGGGYPVGLSGDAICWTAQMCSVVDVYDAYTAQRSYREAIQSQQALAIMRSTSGTQLCTEHVECWNRLVSRLWAVAV